jgi:hypothetical protein
LSEIDVRLSSLEQSLSIHERLARQLVRLLRQAPEGQPEMRAEVCVRRCYFGDDGGGQVGCYFTLYVSGYGNDGESARRTWGTGLKLLGSAILQLSDTSANS